MVDQFGSYQIRVGTSAINFWPLAPGTTVAAATPTPPSLPVTPGTPNTIAVAPTFAIFDILIATSGDAVVNTSITAPTLPTQITATPTTSSGPLIAGTGGTTRISFAVPVTGTSFTGTLRLTAQRGTTAPGTATTLDLLLQITPGTRLADMFVFFVVHAHPPRSYCWTKLQAVNLGTPTAPVKSATGTWRVLRDNATFRSINRQFSITTDTGGFITPAADTTRNVIGLPINWPLIVNLDASGFITRAHLVKLAQANVSNNTAPFTSTPPVRLIATTSASLATRRIMLDAGHGVVYNHTARRSQEWYVASHVIDEVERQLRAAPFNVPAANLFRTRSAGFGLIEPGQINSGGAPDVTTRFDFDFTTGGTVRVHAASVGLKALSDLVLARHDRTTRAALPIADASRDGLLMVNATTVTAIETRLNGQLAGHHRRVRAGSIRWDPSFTGGGDYVFTEEPLPPATTPAAVDRRLPITTADAFGLVNDNMDILAERAALWSVTNELSQSSHTITGHPDFRAATRAAMLADGAVDYMKGQVSSGMVARTPEYLTNGIKGWGPTARVSYFNGNACDFYLSVHENAGGASSRGGAALVCLETTGADRPPDDQIRIGKVCLKYFDGFDQGLNGGGIAREIASNPATMLRHTNTRRNRHLYLESEFMDATAAGGGVFQIENMISGGYVTALATQLVKAIAEFLIDPQSNLDTITFDGSFHSSSGAALW
jgi:N-acetylmuramoyl-L-alanine amidase